VRARWLLLLATACLVPPLLSGCGGGGSDAGFPIGKHLVVYSSLPLQGPLEPQAEAVLDGERLALTEAHRRVGRFRISLVSLDDASSRGVWDPGLTSANARVADRDSHTIAYLGDYDSGATAVSLPANNLAGILQVSPMSTYIGLTSSFEAGQGDPERFYPTGRHNFVRLLPSEAVEAAAQIALMRRLSLHSVYVLADGDPLGAPLASIVASDAKLAGIAVTGEQSLELARATVQTRFSGQIAQVLQSGSQAVFLDGDAGAGAVALWQQLHAAKPSLILLGSSAMASSSFAAAIGDAAQSTYLSTPALPPANYGTAASQVLKQLQRRDGLRPTSYALYGYAAMELVLEAIRRAGGHGDDRRAVVQAALEGYEGESVLGRYSVLPSGETTISAYGVDRVRGGELVPWRSFQLDGGERYEQHVR
jgi:branched-chain amino acid transport system substrate-binding protein